MNIMKAIPVLLMLVAGLLLTACSQQPAKPAAGSAEKIVEQRAKQRWELILQKQYMDAYQYLTPGYRATTPIDIYSVSLRKSPVRWQSATFRSVQCQSESLCIATFDIDAKVVGQLRGADSMAVSSQVQDEWLLVDGQWYYVKP